jgi:hypothetical protein
MIPLSANGIVIVVGVNSMPKPTQKQLQKARERLCKICFNKTWGWSIFDKSCKSGLEALTTDGKDCPYFEKWEPDSNA